MEDLKGVSQPSPHTLDAWEHTLRVVQYLEQFMPVLVGSYREELVADLTVGSAVQWLGRFRQAFNLHYREPLAGDRSPRSLLFLAALYHDIGKPATRVVTHDGRVRFLGHEVESARIVSQRGRALALSVVEIERVQAIVLNHMRVHQLTGVPVSQAHAGNEPKLSRRAIYRFFKDTGPAGVDVCLLSLADLRGTYGVTLPQQLWESELGTCRALLEAYWEKQEEVVSPPRILSGKELMGEFGLSPGKSIGLLLESISEAQAAGEIHDRAEALAFAHYWLQQHNGDEKSREGRKE
jgi:poly(A) polymerase